MNYHGLTFQGSLRHMKQVLCSQGCYTRGMTQTVKQLKAQKRLASVGEGAVQSLTPQDRKFEDSHSEGWTEVGKGHPKDE